MCTALADPMHVCLGERVEEVNGRQACVYVSVGWVWVWVDVDVDVDEWVGERCGGVKVVGVGG